MKKKREIGNRAPIATEKEKENPSRLVYAFIRRWLSYSYYEAKANVERRKENSMMKRK